MLDVAADVRKRIIQEPPPAWSIEYVGHDMDIIANPMFREWVVMP
jgi:hypothetical protein